MKRIDAIRAQIVSVVHTPAGLSTLGRRLVVENPEFRSHFDEGMTYDEIGQGWIEEQIRLYLAVTLDQQLWRELIDRCEQNAARDPDPMGPMFSKWTYVHDDLIENIGAGFGWTGGTPKGLGSQNLAERLSLIYTTLHSLTPTQIKQLELSLQSEDGAQQKSGCYVATAVYGSYDAPEVRVLRRWRDDRLSVSAFGRRFVRLYYATSPHLVRAVGHRAWFVAPSRLALNRLVRILQRSGFSDAG